MTDLRTANQSDCSSELSHHSNHQGTVAKATSLESRHSLKRYSNAFTRQQVALPNTPPPNGGPIFFSLEGAEEDILAPSRSESGGGGEEGRRMEGEREWVVDPSFIPDSDTPPPPAPPVWAPRGPKDTCATLACIESMGTCHLDDDLVRFDPAHSYSAHNHPNPSSVDVGSRKNTTSPSRDGSYDSLSDLATNSTSFSRNGSSASLQPSHPYPPHSHTLTTSHPHHTHLHAAAPARQQPCGSIDSGYSNDLSIDLSSLTESCGTGMSDSLFVGTSRTAGRSVGLSLGHHCNPERSNVFLKPSADFRPEPTTPVRTECEGVCGEGEGEVGTGMGRRRRKESGSDGSTDVHPPTLRSDTLDSGATPVWEEEEEKKEEEEEEGEGERMATKEEVVGGRSEYERRGREKREEGGGEKVEVFSHRRRSGALSFPDRKSYTLERKEQQRFSRSEEREEEEEKGEEEEEEDVFSTVCPLNEYCNRFAVPNTIPNTDTNLNVVPNTIPNGVLNVVPNTDTVPNPNYVPDVRVSSPAGVFGDLVMEGGEEGDRDSDSGRGTKVTGTGCEVSGRCRFVLFVCLCVCFLSCCLLFQFLFSFFFSFFFIYVHVFIIFIYLFISFSLFVSPVLSCHVVVLYACDCSCELSRVHLSR